MFFLDGFFFLAGGFSSVPLAVAEILVARAASAVAAAIASACNLAGYKLGSIRWLGAFNLDLLKGLVFLQLASNAPVVEVGV